VSDRLFVSTRKGLFILKRAASGAWGIAATAFLGDPVVVTLPDPRDGAIHVSADLGHFGPKMFVSRDGGASWAESAVPAYPPMPEGAAPEVNPVSGKAIPWKLVKVWALEAGGADRPGVLWAGTLPGGLFRSEDGGKSWELNRPLWDMPSRKTWFGGGYDSAGIHSVCVDPRDTRCVTVAVSCGGIWRTADGGATWEPRTKGMKAPYMPPEMADAPDAQDPHRLVACPADPDALWVQHHGGIFRSRDGGRSWTEITGVKPSTFGFAVAVHPKDPQTAWFVPATKDEKRIPADGRLVVTRTRDGGATFQTLTAGLPAEPSYDLIYRHSLDVDATGDRLAMGSTTGGVWVTESGGDRWSQVPVRFPPVYAARFG
jgi:photosystem II stability/assembly factor-like uncharacterized protein